MLYSDFFKTILNYKNEETLHVIYIFFKRLLITKMRKPYMLCFFICYIFSYMLYFENFKATLNYKNVSFP